jgi:UDP-GlcNAc:undecaprenyl-phosphate GlcNAc-1-phosphate transferase
MRTFIIAFALSLLAALVLTRVIRDAALRWNLVDAPVGGRKIHRRPIPRLGGVAIILAFAAPLLGLFCWDNDLSSALFSDQALLISLLGGGGIIALTGIVDDLRGLRSLVKLAAQIAAGLVVYSAGIRIEAFSVPFFSPVILDVWLSLPLTLFWVVLVTNAVNLIDGMDGLAGGVAVLAGGTLMIMSGIEGNTLAALLLCCMVGATLGFLVYNINPASIFMGDTGSLSLGFLLALVSIHSSQKSYALFSIVAAFLVLGIPIFDLSMAVVRRYLMGRPIFAADQHHVHHILLRKGLTQSQSVIMLFGAAVFLEVLAFIFIYADDRISAISILVLVPIIGAAVRYLGYDRIIASARRARVMETIEARAQVRSEAVDAFRESLIRHPNLSELEGALAQVALELGLERLEMQLKFSLRHGEERTRYHWTRGNLDGEDVHIQDLVERSFSLKAGGFEFGTLTVSVLGDREVFRPHDAALHRALADALTISLLSRSGSLLPQVSSGSSETGVSWN